MYHLLPLKSQFRKEAKRPVVRAATSSGFLGKGGSERSQQHLPQDSGIAAAHGGQGGGFGVSIWVHMEWVGSKKQAKDEKKEYTWQEREGLTHRSLGLEGSWPEKRMGEA